MTSALSHEELHDFTRAQVTWVESCLADGTHDGWVPHLSVLAMNMKGELSTTLMSLAVPFGSADEKQAALRRCGAQVFSDMKAPVCPVLSVEAWMAPDGGCEPKDHPDRQECVLVCGLSIIDQKAAYCFYRSSVTRDSQNHIIAGPFEHWEGAQFPLLRHVYQGWATAALKSGAYFASAGLPGQFVKPLASGAEVRV